MKKVVSTLTLHIFCLTILSLCFKSISGTTEIIIDKPKDIIIFNNKNLILPKKKDYKELHEDYLEMKKQQAYDLANKYLKYKMDCYKLAIKYVRELKGIDKYELIKIKEKDVELGDIAFYQNNGIGQTHYSVVLDLDNNIALHGNIDGKTKIRKVYEPNMAKPIFYRLERK